MNHDQTMQKQCDIFEHLEVLHSIGGLLHLILEPLARLMAIVFQYPPKSRSQQSYSKEFLSETNNPQRNGFLSPKKWHILEINYFRNGMEINSRQATPKVFYGYFSLTSEEVEGTVL